MQDHDPLSVLFDAFADSTRRAILSRLAAGPQTPQQISETLELDPRDVVAQLARLERDGMIIPEPATGPDAVGLRVEGVVLLENWLAWFRRFRLDSHARLQSLIDEDAPPDLD